MPTCHPAVKGPSRSVTAVGRGGLGESCSLFHDTYSTVTVTARTDHRHDSQGSCWHGFVLIIFNSRHITSQNSASSLCYFLLLCGRQQAGSFSLRVPAAAEHFCRAVQIPRNFLKSHTSLNGIFQRKYFLFARKKKTFSPLWLLNISQFLFQMF